MKSLIEYIYEVSKETSDNAFLKASKEVIELSNEVTKDNFKNKELAMKLCKRIRQANLFREYSDKLNAMTASAVPESFAKCIKKWKDHGIKIDKTKITPIFMLSGFDEKEFICISSNREYNFLSGTGNYDAVMVIPSDKRKKPYKAAQERVKDLINSDHKILPTQLLVIIPGTEEIDIENNKVDKRSKAYKVAQSFLKQLMEIKEDIHNEFGIKPADSWQKMYTLNKSKMSTPSDWNNLKWGMKGEELERVLQSNSLDQLFPDKDGVIYMSIDIPKDIQKQFDMHGSILLTKDEIKNIEFELNNDGSKNDEANYNKYGRSYSSLKNGRESGRVRGDRYGKEL